MLFVHSKNSVEMKKITEGARGAMSHSNKQAHIDVTYYYQLIQLIEDGQSQQ